METVLAAAWVILGSLSLFLCWNGYPRSMKWNDETPPRLVDCWAFRNTPYSKFERQVFFGTGVICLILAFVSMNVNVTWG